MKEKLLILVKTSSNQYKQQKMTESKQKTVYVVTRNSRRTEFRNYETKAEAEVRAEKLVNVLKKWKDPDQRKVRVVETLTPLRIR